jgi:hypothetical protein
MNPYSANGTVRVGLEYYDYSVYWKISHKELLLGAWNWTLATLINIHKKRTTRRPHGLLSYIYLYIYIYASEYKYRSTRSLPHFLNVQLPILHVVRIMRQFEGHIGTSNT